MDIWVTFFQSSWITWVWSQKVAKAVSSVFFLAGIEGVFEHKISAGATDWRGD